MFRILHFIFSPVFISKCLVYQKNSTFLYKFQKKGYSVAFLDLRFAVIGQLREFHTS